MTTHLRTWSHGLLAVALAGVSGCFSIFAEPEEPPRVLRFRLDYDAPKPASSPLPYVLRVLPLRSGANYDTDAIVVRNGDHVDERYHYRRWATQPARMIGDLVRRDLAESGLFEAVIPGPSPLANDYLLSGAVEEIEERRGTGCQAHLRIRFVLAQQNSAAHATPVFQKAYEAGEACIAGDANDFVSAMSRAMRTLSGHLRSDIAAALRTSAPAINGSLR